MRGLLAVVCLAALLGCDRNMEPYVPGEEPRQPDLSKIFPAGADQVARMDGNVELPPAPGAPGAGRQGPDPTANAEPISGVVRLSPELEGRVAAGGVLFLIARRGPGPPVAVQRVGEPRFPLRFSIGPSDRMIQGIPFAGPLELEARLDSDGEATSRSPDDLEGQARGGFQPGATGVDIVLVPRGGPAQAATAVPAATAAARPAADAQPIRGVIRVSPELAGRMPQGAVLFLIARVGAGGPPLAVQRIMGPSFPHEFSIGPDDRMIKARPFSGAIQLTARLDLDGNAMSRSPGDLQGSARAAHAPGDSGVEIVLDQLL
jgi:hypothetical protein